MASRTVNGDTNNSDSDISDWAVVDEDSSLEWNDEEKYHFRHTKAEVIDPSHEASDEDSIEVVSDVDVNEVEEDHQADDNHEKPVSINAAADHASKSLDSSTNMVWFRLSTSTTPKGLQDATSAENEAAVNPRDNWDLVVILFVALIGGIALGYFWGLHHDEAATCKKLAAKLQFENHFLRHKLRCLTLKPKLAASSWKPTQCSDLQQLVDESFAQITLPEDEEITLQLNLKEDSISPDVLKRNTDDALKGVGETKVSETNYLKDNISNDKTQTTLPNPKHLTSAEENVPLSDDLKINFSHQKMRSQRTNPPELKDTVANVFSLLSSSWVDSNHSNILESIGRNLQAIDSVQREQISPKLYAKFSSIRLQTHKASNKLVNKVDKYLHKLSTKILRRLQKFQSNQVQNFCALKQITETNNVAALNWPEDLSQECALSKNYGYKNDVKLNEESRTKRNLAKEKRPLNQNSYKNVKPKKLFRKGKDTSDQKMNQNDEGFKVNDKLRDANDSGREKKEDDLFSASSNVSGDWVIKMADARAVKRDHEHQSDWLFERAQARKCHRDDHFNRRTDEKEEAFQENSSRSKRPRKKFRKFVEMLHNVIPDSIVDGMRSFKSAFKELRNKVRNPTGR